MLCHMRMSFQNYMARTMGNGFQKLQIALVMTNIDLAIIKPTPEEPENPVRAQNKEDDAWAIQQKAHREFSRHVGIFQTASA